MKISSVYKREAVYELTGAAEVIKSIRVNYNEQSINYMTDNDIYTVWSTLEKGRSAFWEDRRAHGEDIEIILEFTDETDYNFIRLFHRYNYSPRIFTEGAVFCVSGDGENWRRVNIINDNGEDYYIDNERYRYMKIVFPGDIPAIWEISEILLGRIEYES